MSIWILSIKISISLNNDLKFYIVFYLTYVYSSYCKHMVFLNVHKKARVIINYYCHYQYVEYTNSCTYK